MTDPDGRTVVQCETEGFSGRKQTISIDGGPVYRMSSKDMKKWEVEVQGDTFRWKKATESELKPLGVKKVRRGFQMLAPNGQLVALLGREKDKKVWHFAFFGLAAEGARDGDWMLAVATSGIMVLHVSIVKGVADAVGDAAGLHHVQEQRQVGQVETHGGEPTRCAQAAYANRAFSARDRVRTLRRFVFL